MNIIIIGTGGLAKALWGTLNHINKIRYGVTVRGFVSEKPQTGIFCGLPILGDDEWLANQTGLDLIIGIGSPTLRKKVAEKFPMHNFPSFIHPNVITLGEIKYGKGCTIMPGCIFEPDISIGNFTHFEMGVTVGHDVTIGNYCVINHNAGISGNVTIEDEIMIGAGATIIETNRIGNGSILGAGAVLTKSIPDGQVWIGIPAKQLEKK